jgi:hypothetical protein
MSYLHQHYRAMQISEPLDFTHPKDKRNGDRVEDKRRDSKKRNCEDKRPVSKREKPLKERSEHKKRKINKIPVKLQCKRAQCVERGTHLNHTHRDCRFKGENTPNKLTRIDKKHPNLGKAPTKKHKRIQRIKPKQTLTQKIPLRQGNRKRYNGRRSAALLYL